jgi:hypothetical protein
VNRSLFWVGVLAPPAALAVLVAAPAQARTDEDGGRAAAPAAPASAAPVVPPPAGTAPAETGLDLGASRVMKRCDATARSTLRDATTIAAGGTDAAAAPGAPLEALQMARVRDVVADCAAARSGPVRPLTGPVPGALFRGSPGPSGVIPDRNLS